MNTSTHLAAPFTIADLNVSCVANSLNMVQFDFSPYPKTARWMRACMGRPAQQEVMANFK